MRESSAAERRAHVPFPAVIKYLGSKRRLVPALTAIARRLGRTHGARSVHGNDARRAGIQVAVASRSPRSTAPATRRRSLRCYIATDAARHRPRRARSCHRRPERAGARARLCDRVFAAKARYLQPHNAARESTPSATPSIVSGAVIRYESILLTSLDRGGRPGRLDDRRADGVRQAVGAALATAAATCGCRPCSRAEATRCTAMRATSRPAVGHFDLAYLDPPYNQHRYTANYHVWETLVAWDAPEHYGVACKRDELRDPATRSVFNSRRTMPAALHQVIDDLDADLLVVSCSNEGWVGIDELTRVVSSVGDTSRWSRSTPAAMSARRSACSIRRGNGSARCRTCTTSSTSCCAATARSCGARRAGRSVEQRADQRVDLGQRLVRRRARERRPPADPRPPTRTSPSWSIVATTASVRNRLRWPNTWRSLSRARPRPVWYRTGR